MVNNPKLIQKVIMQIKDLTFEELDSAIKEVDKMFDDNIKLDMSYIEIDTYAFSRKLNTYKTVHRKMKEDSEAA